MEEWGGVEWRNGEGWSGAVWGGKVVVKWGGAAWAGLRWAGLLAPRQTLKSRGLAGRPRLIAATSEEHVGSPESLLYYFCVRRRATAYEGMRRGSIFLNLIYRVVLFSSCLWFVMVFVFLRFQMF